jgi:tryptophan synthase alpha chain
LVPRSEPGNATERLRAAFPSSRAALIPYLTAGYPSLDGAREVGEAYIEAGADVVEIGVPFSDPLADGPTIQGTTTQALENGANIDYCLRLADELSGEGRPPVVLLIYYNNILARGTGRFFEEAAESGVAGLVVPDLPVDEIPNLGDRALGSGVALCPLAAPTSTDARLAEIGRAGAGFVYCVSVAGVTGVRDSLPPGSMDLLRRVKSFVDAPVALGFGIGSVGAAVEASAEADGVIVGSKLMQLVGEGGTEAAGSWLREVRGALDASGASEVAARSAESGV